MQPLPTIELGHLLYVMLWALLGMCVSAIAWANGEVPTYKDYLAGTLGISFEALGVEIADRHPSMIVPLAVGLLCALLIRYLPNAKIQLRIRRRRLRVGQTLWGIALVLAFFCTQAVVLLLS